MEIRLEYVEVFQAMLGQKVSQDRVLSFIVTESEPVFYGLVQSYFVQATAELQQKKDASMVCFVLTVLRRRVKIHGFHEHTFFSFLVEHMSDASMLGFHTNNSLDTAAALIADMLLLYKGGEMNILAVLQQISQKLPPQMYLKCLREIGIAALIANSHVRLALLQYPIATACGEVLCQVPSSPWTADAVETLTNWLNAGLLPPRMLVLPLYPQGPRLMEQICTKIGSAVAPCGDSDDERSVDAKIVVISKIADFCDAVKDCKDKTNISCTIGRPVEEEEDMGGEEDIGGVEDEEEEFSAYVMGTVASTLQGAITAYQANIVEMITNVELCDDDEELLAVARIITSTAYLLGTNIGDEGAGVIWELLISLVRRSSTFDAVCEIALEVWPNVHKSLPKSIRRANPALFAQLFEVFFSKHLVEPEEFKLDQGEYEGAEEDWLVCRDNYSSETIFFIYTELRTSLLQTLHRLLTSSDQQPTSEVIEAVFFTLRQVSFELTKRAMLCGMSASSIHNAYKANKMKDFTENEDEIENDARQTSAFLRTLLSMLFVGTRQTAPAGQVNPWSSPSVIREGCKLIGCFASWMCKSKLSEQETAGGPSLPELVAGSFDFLLNGIAFEPARYWASNSLRTLCTHSGKVGLENIDALLASWAAICQIQQEPRSKSDLLKSSRILGIGRGEEEGEECLDVAQESRKSVLQALCQTLKNCSDESILNAHFSRLMSVPLGNLQQLVVTARGDGCAGLSAAQRTFLSEEVCNTIELIAIFIRSVRMPMRVDQHHVGFAAHQQQLRAHNAEAHPAVQLVSTCGTVFSEIFALLPSPKLASRISYLCQSLTTFVSPALPFSGMPNFLDFVWTQQGNNLLPFNISAVNDLAIEVIAVIGGSTEATLTNHSVVPGVVVSNEEKADCERVLHVTTDMIKCIFTKIREGAGGGEAWFDAKSGELDALFELFGAGMTRMPLSTFSLDLMPIVIACAVDCLTQSSQQSTVRSAVVLLCAFINLKDSVGAQCMEVQMRPLTADHTWSVIGPLVTSLVISSKNAMLLSCLDKMLVNVTPYVEHFGTLLFTIFRHAPPTIQELQELGASTLQAAARVSGGSGVRTDQELVAYTLSFFNDTILALQRASTSGGGGGGLADSSLFLDCIDDLHKAAVGKSSIQICQKRIAKSLA